MTTAIETPELTDDQVNSILPEDRESPFAGIGTATEGAGTARDALKSAGALWTAEKVQLKNPVTGNPIHGYYAVVRQDNKEVLGVVEGQYHVVQNQEFFDIADLFVADGAKITRVSYLHRSIEMVDETGKPLNQTRPVEVGGQVYMNIMWPIKKTALSVKGDIVGRTALIRTGHDGKFSGLITLRMLQLACLNGAVVPVPGFSFDFRISHTISATKRIEEAKKVLAAAPKYFDYAGRAMAMLADHKVTDATAKRLAALTVNPIHPDKLTSADEDKVAAIVERFNGQMPRGNSEAVKGTAYGWITAVWDFADYGTRIKRSEGYSERQQRFKSAFGGVGHTLKLTAWDALDAEFDLQKRVKALTN